MKKEIKKIWLEALRSGKYKKTKSVLKTSKGYCCLGVLTDLYIKKTGRGKWVATDYFGAKNTKRYEYGTIKETTVLPSNVQKWAGLNDSNPLIKLSEGDSLASLNDGLNDKRALSFKSIAKIIEAQL